MLYDDMAQRRINAEPTQIDANRRTQCGHNRKLRNVK